MSVWTKFGKVYNEMSEKICRGSPACLFIILSFWPDFIPLRGITAPQCELVWCTSRR